MEKSCLYDKNNVESNIDNDNSLHWIKLLIKLFNIFKYIFVTLSICLGSVLLFEKNLLGVIVLVCGIFGFIILSLFVRTAKNIVK